MAKVQIFEKLRCDSIRIREAEVPEEYLSAVTTLLYRNGAYQKDLMKPIFEVERPRLLYLVKEIEQKWPEIKFVEVKGKEFNIP